MLQTYRIVHGFLSNCAAPQGVTVVWAAWGNKLPRRPRFIDPVLKLRVVLLRRIDEVDFAAVGDEAGGDAFAQELADGGAALVAVVEG